MAASSSRGVRIAGDGAGAAIVAAITVSLIYFGRDVLLPIALAILLSFLLAPLVRVLQKWRFPHAFSVIAVVALAFLALFAIGGTIAMEATKLASDLPLYRSTLDEKIGSLRSTIAEGSPFARAAGVLEDLGKQISKPVTAGMNAMTQSPEQVPVEVRQAPAGPFERLSSVIAELLLPLATTGITFTYVIFILLQQEDLRNRLIKLAGMHDLHKATTALDDAGRRLSRLLLAELAVNSAFGVIIGAGLWMIGVPSPVLWGILSAILRFIPYIGALISGLFPLTLAIAVEPGWSKAILTGLLYISIDAFIGNLIEPLLYGRSSGLSPIAVVVSATFWTFLWGPIGLVLAVPMTICLVVMGHHVESLRFLDVLLGDEPPLSPPEIFYQRILAGDAAEEVGRAKRVLREKPLPAYYDDVALAGLKLAHNDFARGCLDLSRIGTIRTAIGVIIDRIGEYGDQTLLQKAMPNTQSMHNTKVTAAEFSAAQDDIHGDLARSGGQPFAPKRPARVPVLCIAGRSQLDECAALMLAQLLGKHGLNARVEGPEILSATGLIPIDTEGAAIVFLSYFASDRPAHIRYDIRCSRKRLPNAKILLGCWMAGGDSEDLKERVKVDGIATTLKEALELCRNAAYTP
jgi:predicted PurR-regulated permease PerM